MKAFAVYEKDMYHRAAELVFANTAQEAKKLGYGGDCCCDTHWHDVRVKRVPDADKLCKRDTPYVVGDVETLRAAGWQCEDGRSCKHCGLNDFDDDRWRVCDECDACIVCGHDDDCPNQGA
jgi:hypothetical protein